MSLTDLAFSNEAFDVILCYHVLEHIPDDTRAMRELCRALRPGGVALLQSYQDPELAVTREDPDNESPAERARLFGQHDHYRIYGRDYAARLREAGFAVQLVDFAAELGSEAVNRYGLDIREVLHVCRKAVPARHDYRGRVPNYGFHEPVPLTPVRDVGVMRAGRGQTDMTFDKRATELGASRSMSGGEDSDYEDSALHELPL